MASTKFDGKNLRIYVDTFPVACAQTASLSITKDMLDVTCKDSAGTMEFIPGSYGWEMSADGVTDFTATFNVSGMSTKLLAGTQVTLLFETATSGDVTWTGSAYLTSIEVSAANNEASTYSCSFQGTGALTQGVKA